MSLLFTDCSFNRRDLVAEMTPSAIQDADVLSSRFVIGVPYRGAVRYGWVDRWGRVVIEPRFAYADRFSEGLAVAAEKKGRFGYVDRDGQYAIPAEYSGAARFCENLARVEIGRTESRLGRFGFIDRLGNIVVPVAFEASSWFSGGLCAVQVDGKWGYINTSGEMVIKAIFDYAFEFSEGLASVQLGGKWGYIDSQGAYRVEPRYLGAGTFREGIAVVWPQTEDGPPVWWLNLEGEVIHEFPYVVTAPQEGLATFWLSARGQCGYVNTAGAEAIPALYLQALEFTEGLAAVAIEPQGGRFSPSREWVYIDRTGNRVISERFFSAYRFEDGLAKVSTHNRVGYIDHSGEWVWSGRVPREH